ncbi:MAG: hypothetical protein FJZ56_00535 [Chlamydiae bacterium]|nr:hypothetical protein [Chlamydiota bacterium]
MSTIELTNLRYTPNPEPSDKTLGSLGDRQVTCIESFCDAFYLGENPSSYEYAKVAAIWAISIITVIPIIVFIGCQIYHYCSSPTENSEHSTASFSDRVSMDNAIELTVTSFPKKNKVDNAYECLKNHLFTPTSNTSNPVSEALNLRKSFSDDAALKEAVTMWFPVELDAYALDTHALQNWLKARTGKDDSLEPLNALLTRLESDPETNQEKDAEAYKNCLLFLDIAMKLDSGQYRVDGKRNDSLDLETLFDPEQEIKNLSEYTLNENYFQIH